MFHIMMSGNADAYAPPEKIETFEDIDEAQRAARDMRTVYPPAYFCVWIENEKREAIPTPKISGM